MATPAPLPSRRQAEPATEPLRCPARRHRTRSGLRPQGRCFCTRSTRVDAATARWSADCVEPGRSNNARRIGRHPPHQAAGVDALGDEQPVSCPPFSRSFFSAAWNRRPHSHTAPSASGSVQARRFADQPMPSRTRLSSDTPRAAASRARASGRMAMRTRPPAQPPPLAGAVEDGSALTPAGGHATSASSGSIGRNRPKVRRNRVPGPE